jgi:hypothetical protein
MIDRVSARQQLAAARDVLDQLAATIETDLIRLHPGQPVQAALDLADAGAVIELEPGTYEGSLVFRRPVTLRPTVPVPPGRRARDFEPVTLTSAGDTVRIVGPDVVHLGLAYRSTAPLQTIVTIAAGAERTILDRPLVLGHPVTGQRRGIRADGTGTRILGAYVDDCFLPMKDTQAVYGANGTRDLMIDDGYFSAGAETIMFGGEDSSSEDKMPRGIVITNSVLTKNPAWYAMGVQIKNAFELKSAADVYVADTELGYAGISEGQGGYICVLTVRNQNGKAPWSTIQHVVMERITAHHGAGAVNFLGRDSNHESGTMSDVILRDWTVTDLDPQGITKGAGWLFLMQRAPQTVTIERFAATGQNMRAGLYVDGVGKAPPVGVVMRSVRMPKCTYPFKINDGGATLAAMQAYMPDAIFESIETGGSK